MGEQLPTNSNNNADEIDLGQLFQMIKNAFSKVFEWVLRAFLYFKKNLVILIILGVVGVGIGYGLNQISESKQKTEIIVKPNFESKDYLYGVIEEIESKIKGEDFGFFKKLEINLEFLKGFKVEIEPVTQNVKSDLHEELKYLEYLGDLKEEGSIQQVIKNEVLGNSYVNYKISFYFKDVEKGHDAAKKIMSYINNNEYFKDLREIYVENAESRIKENDKLIQQIDILIDNYSKALGTKSNQSSGDGTVLLGGEEGLNIPSLLNLKNTLIQSNATNRISLKEMQETIKVLNFGQPHEVKKNFFGHSLVLIPSILIGLFFVWSFLKYLNTKAKHLTQG